MQTDGVKNTLSKVVSAEFDLPRYNLILKLLHTVVHHVPLQAPRLLRSLLSNIVHDKSWEESANGRVPITSS